MTNTNIHELASLLITNAEMIPDPRRQGATDCYAVTLDDLEALSEALAEIRKSETTACEACVTQFGPEQRYGKDAKPYCIHVEIATGRQSEGTHEILDDYQKRILNEKLILRAIA